MTARRPRSPWRCRRRGRRPRRLGRDRLRLSPPLRLMRQASSRSLLPTTEGAVPRILRSSPGGSVIRSDGSERLLVRGGDLDRRDVENGPRNPLTVNWTGREPVQPEPGREAHMPPVLISVMGTVVLLIASAPSAAGLQGVAGNPVAADFFV